MSRVALAFDPDAVAEIADQIADRVAVKLADRLRHQEQGGWMDAKAAAEYAGCSLASLHRAMAARLVQFSQNVEGGKAYFRREWIDEWRGR